MLKTLIVDDEPSHVQGLIRHIPWMDLGYSTPLTALSGESALPILQSHKIDVLITDVSMPGMNGIELAATAKTIHPDIQILIISGYNEFEFAQEAIDVGAMGYVLKPLKLQEVLRKLSTFRQTLENINQINEQTMRLKTMVSESRELLKDSFIFDLLEDEPVEEDMLVSWCQLLNLPELKEGIQLIVASLDNYAASGNDAKERLMLSSALLQSVTVSLRDMGVVLVSKLRPDEVAVIMVNPTADYKSGIDKQMSFVQEFILNAYKASVTVGISRSGDEWKESWQLFREVKYTIADSRQSGSGLLVHVGSMERKAYEDFRVREALIPSLLTLAENYESVQLSKAIGRAFNDLDAKAHSFAYIQSFSISLLGELTHKFWHDTEVITFQSKRVLHRLLECNTVSELKDIVLEYIDSVILLAQKERTLQQHHLINCISSYIEDQLPSNVTVKQLADKFHLSAGHLSVLFKKETGQTISDFVKKLRMKKAKELLQDPTIKVYEVADRVGFQTPAYFTYQFKKNEGCTPQEYRDRFYR
ncbi:response regulator [Paenibacillus sp. Soil750]|uniref:response regulator n=1 Tax=Paenibacillus sp. Soil750 TaxID=1736398 RepID=UPI0006F9C002|nr:response regulator [Paenibacillus sp. Soil750]KRE69730.1 hypothetical protein ASL11_15290 [Paenibacillus sp. Soil750]